MRHLKLLGLAALAAIALTAVVGTVTASAAEICTAPAVNKMCPEGKLITTIEVSQVGTATQETTGGVVLSTCKGAEGDIDVTEQGTGVELAQGTNTKLLFTECTNTVTTLRAGTLDATAVGGFGTLSATGAEVTVNGIFGASCVYGSGPSLDIGTTSGATGTSLNVNSVVPRISGGISCPADTVWKASFKITNHTTVHFIDN